MNLVNKVEKMLDDRLRNKFKQDELIVKSRKLNTKEQQAILNNYFKKLLYRSRVNGLIVTDLTQYLNLTCTGEIWLDLFEHHVLPKLKD